MPLCIAGMHRSGTSLLANLLHACGLDLGPADDLLPAAPSNPHGFWESRAFLRLNDAVLKARGGSWDHPPPDAAGWQDAPALRRLRLRAGRLASTFAGREPWGWKDPRNCLTLPLWRAVVPRLRVLVCVRNPLAVAESLWQRDGLPHAAAFDLWLTYTRRLLAAAPPGDRLVTHCEDFCFDPRAELGRVLAWCGIRPAAGRVRAACRRFDPALVHHRLTDADLAGSAAPPEVVECYLRLRTEAGYGERGASAPRLVGAETGG